MTEHQPPILRRLTVDSEPAKAFDAFTNDIGIWWPKAFSASGDGLGAVTIEQRAGGRVFETAKDGSETPWGSVVAIEPGKRLVMEWHLGLAGGQRTEVEIAFLPSEMGRADIGFVHRGWHAETGGQRAKFDHAEGWDKILRAYRDYARWHAAKAAPETTTSIVASRRLWIATESELTAVQVRIYAPQAADGSWGCRYEIDWPNGTRGMTMFGVDSVQALNLAMSMVGTELYGSPYHEAGTLMFDGPGTGYGFPVAPNCREDLIGDDRVSF